jgi:L-asparaginase II
MHAQSTKVSSTSNPILLEVMRGDIVESIHRGAAVVVNNRGKALRSWGDILSPISPRSSMKLIYAIPFIESGAADTFDLGAIEIALACSSHVGSQLHVGFVKFWLKKVGLTVDRLQCGIHAPFSKEMCSFLSKTGQKPNALHNNNSGKHAALLTTAKHLGEPLDDYLDRNHPVQERVRRTTEIMAETDLRATVEGKDRCGMPMSALPLQGIARAMAQLGRPDLLAPTLATVSSRIINAVREHPLLLMGPGRLPTLVNQITQGRIILKGGSEGVYAGCAPERGLGFAIKIDDGADRAAGIAVMNLLLVVRAFTAAELSKLTYHLARPILDARGEKVGIIRSAGSFRDTRRGPTFVLAS